jgi:hypothetical protein
MRFDCLPGGECCFALLWKFHLHAKMKKENRLMATLCCYTYRGVNICLTRPQRELLKLIEGRTQAGIPAVQRDLAEALGIRRDSLNKLLARTRRALATHGVELLMPQRCRPGVAAALDTLDGFGSV